MPNVGDKVLYVPSVSHAFEKLPDGTYPWLFSEATNNPKEPQKDIPAPKTQTVMDKYRNRPGGPRRVMTPKCPQTSWPAEIVAVREDGTVDLKIEHPFRGVTLNYTRIKEDPSGKEGHTWRTGAAFQVPPSSSELAPTPSEENTEETL